MNTPLHFLLFTHFETHPAYFSSDEEMELFAEYATNNIYSLSRCFPNHQIIWKTISYKDLENNIEIDCHQYDAVFVGGSPWSVYDEKKWMKTEEKILCEGWKHSTPPFFGICFGHQLFAKMLGGEISCMQNPIKKNITYAFENHFLTSWCNHKEYVSKLPNHTQVYSVVEQENLSIPYIVRYHPNIWGLQAHVEKNIGDDFSESFWKSFFQKNILGASLGIVDVDGISLEVLFCPSPKFTYTLDNNGKYLAIKGQCVELVRRFIYERFDVNLAEFFVDGHATHWYENAEIMHLKRIEKNDVSIGDILCFSGGFYAVGHLAIVQKVVAEGIFIVQQNVFHDERDLHFFLPFLDFNFNGFVYQGALRYYI